MTRLTKPMRAALQEARRTNGLRRVHNPDLPGKPTWPAHHSTLAALVRHQLVTLTNDRNRKGWPRTTWTITDTGRKALQPRERFIEQSPRFLQRDIWRGGDYTTERHRAIDDLAVNDGDPSVEWERAAARRHAAAQDRRARARRARAA